VDLDDKLAALETELQRLGRVVVAFSGGADSAFLAAVANRTLGPDAAHAVTAVSPVHAVGCSSAAAAQAAESIAESSACFSVTTTPVCQGCHTRYPATASPLTKRISPITVNGLSLPRRRRARRVEPSPAASRWSDAWAIPTFYFSRL